MKSEVLQPLLKKAISYSIFMFVYILQVIVFCYNKKK